jgi:hypothetical protein
MKVMESFRDHQLEPISPAEDKVLFWVEARAREACSAFPGDDELVRRSGLGERTVRRVLDALQAKGYLLQIMKDQGRRLRLGILLLKRANGDRPVFDPVHDDMDEVVAAMCRRRGVPKPKYSIKLLRAEPAKMAATMPAKMAATMPAKMAAQSEASLSSSRGISEQSESRGEQTETPTPARAPEIASPQRQRPETPEASAPPPPPAPARGGLHGLPDLADAPKDDPIIAAELARRQRARQAALPVAPPQPPPQDTAELIRRLPGADSHWTQMAAEDLSRRFGTARDRQLWGQYHAIMRDVWSGALDPEAVVDCYRQGSKPECRNGGAVFWTALKRHLEGDGP